MVSAKLKIFLTVLSSLLLAFILVSRYFPNYREFFRKKITNYEQCVRAGYPVRETYPENCVTPEGRIFTRNLAITGPTPVKMLGTHVCLPKKELGQGTTLECTFGLQGENGFYALDLSALPPSEYPTLLGNDMLTVEGTLTPAAQVTDPTFLIYDIQGVITVSKMVIN